jgi:hypothetical protein
MSGWNFGGWPPPPPSAGGSVTFQAVKDALSVADTAVPFNLQALSSVLNVNGVELLANNDRTGLSIGDTDAGLPLATNRIAIGLHALESAQAGSADSLAIGNNALREVTTGDSNLSIGFDALPAVTTGSSNVGLGHNVGLLLDTGARNVLIGVSAGQDLTGGIDNTFVGTSAGAGATGNTSICIGSSASPADPTLNNQLNIGGRIYGGPNGSNYKLRLGGGTGTIATQSEAFQVNNTDTDAVAVQALNTTGTNGAKVSMYAGTRDPNGAVSALGGSIYFRVAGASSGIYVNKTAGIGTTWSLITAVP